MSNTKGDYISSYISKLFRSKFGRGPLSCRTTICNKHVVTYISGFITPMEEILLEQGQQDFVDKARNLIMSHLLDEIKGVIQVSLDIEVEDQYQDWNFPNNTGILIFSFVSDGSKDESFNSEIDIKRLEDEIARISFLVQKVPDIIITHPISPTIYLVERIGILVQIEKALISRGFQQELLFTKDELEKKYFHRDGRFDVIFTKPVKDIFIDWNLKEDKSYMAFILSSK